MDGGTDPQVDLTLVIPLYNEEEVFPLLVSRLRNALDNLAVTAEVIFVDDGSTDSTPRRIEQVCREDERFRGVLLSRNFGQQLAITAGLHHARGQAVAILDGDLQDPPEILGTFYAKLQEGYDVVYAIREKRQESLWRRLAYMAFYRILRRLATVPVPLDSGDFCVMSRRVVRTLNRLPERHRFIRGLRSWVGFRQVGCRTARPARVGGAPKYTLAKLLRLALDGICTLSEGPLRWAAYSGLGVLLLTLAGTGWFILQQLLRLEPPPVLTVAAIGMFFLGGVQLLCIGILGEYVARIYREVQGRPLYLVDRRCGFQDEHVPHNAAWGAAAPRRSVPESRGSLS